MQYALNRMQVFLSQHSQCSCRFMWVYTLDIIHCCRMCPSLSTIFPMSLQAQCLFVCVCVCVCVQSFSMDSLLLFSRQSALDSCIIQACSLQCSYSDLLPLTLSSFPIFFISQSFSSSILLCMPSNRGGKYSGYVWNEILVYCSLYTTYILYTMSL